MGIGASQLVSVESFDQAAKREAKSDGKRKPKRSPLAGWFGKRTSESDVLPVMDVSRGVSRAMRLVQTSAEMQVRGQTREPIRIALCAIENALSVIDTVRDTIEEGFEIAINARETDDIAARALFAEKYDELRLSIESLAQAAATEHSETHAHPALQGDTNPLTLTGIGRKQIDVQLGGQAHYSVSPTILDASTEGLNLNPPRDAFSTDEEITETLEELDRALQKADRAAAGYCRDAQFLIARLELTALP